MLLGETITCFIPAKGTSQRLAGKNLRICDGKYLVAYPLCIAELSDIFDFIVLSSENEEILELRFSCCFRAVIPHERPEGLSRTKSIVWDAVRHWMGTQRTKTDYIMLLHPTSPCIKPKTVVHAMEQLVLHQEFNSLRSVSKISPYNFRSDKISEVDFERPSAGGSQFYETHFCLNNAINIVRWSTLASGESIFKDWMPYLMEDDEAVDVDTENDLHIAEAILQWRKSHEESQEPASPSMG